MGLLASKCWVVSITSLTVIEGEEEGSVVVAVVGIGVTRRKDTG